LRIAYTIDRDYIIRIRREIHEYPELGWDLPKTSELVKRELSAMGIEYTEEYGACSVVGIINPHITDVTIGIRADMDALPVDEVNELDFKSKVSGRMHACGHDAHTAMLLGTAKALSEIRDQLTCRVKLIFQPCEEGPELGGALMVERGVMDDVDVVIAQHVDTSLKTGEIGIVPGNAMASARRFIVEFFGKTTHGTLPHKGINALAMAVRAYDGINQMQVMEIDPFAEKICTIGSFHSGFAANVLPDYAMFTGTIRTYDTELDQFIFSRIQTISQNAAEELGGTCKVTSPRFTRHMYNDPEISEEVIKSASTVVGADNVKILTKKMGSDDFSFFAAKKKGALFRLGIRNEEKGCITPVHTNTFCLDEDAMTVGTAVFVQYVIDHMDRK